MARYEIFDQKDQLEMRSVSGNYFSSVFLRSGLKAAKFVARSKNSYHGCSLFSGLRRKFADGFDDLV